jgi:two-component system, NarL family, nitrate/nitrite response regulator NarL
MPRRSARVLIVDDSDEIRQALHVMLESGGFTVVGTANRGEDGVELAQELEPDVVLMDVHMSGIDGLEATRRIKEANSFIEVVILSADDDPALSQRAVELGVFSYLLKDSSPSLIGDVIARAWAHGRGA